MEQGTPEQVAAKEPPGRGAPAKERIVRTSYELFRRNGFRSVGVDRVVAEAGVAKTTLYRYFPSKDALGVAVVERHQRVWTHDWLEQEADRRATPSEPGIIALFDALDEWYRSTDYEGCLFTNTVVEQHDRASAPRTAAVTAIGNVHALLRRLAEDAGVRDAATFAHQIQILIRGSIVAAVEGHLEAVAQARVIARLLLEHEEHENRRRDEPLQREAAG